jgi:hypothetical protein
MSRLPQLAALALAVLLALCGAPRARAIFGIADTSFVTVIANPAEAADWAAELERLGEELETARNTLQTVSDLRAIAGNPAAAVATLSDLQDITDAVGTLSSGGQTAADLERAWQALGTAQRLAGAAAVLQGAGAGTTMQVFGQPQARNASVYSGFAEDAAAAGQIRGQIAGEQSARSSVAFELARAWAQFKASTNESQKQSILSEISQLQSQNQVMDTRRRAILDDLDLSDREAREYEGVRTRAADEQLLAESALLNADARARAQGAEAQRMATLQRIPAVAGAADYSGIRLWTTADTRGPSP